MGARTEPHLIVAIIRRLKVNRVQGVRTIWYRELLREKTARIASLAVGRGAKFRSRAHMGARTVQMSPFE